MAGRLRRWNVPHPVHQALRRPRYRRIALYCQQVAGRSGSLHQLHPNERSARRRCRCAHRRPTDRLIAVSEKVEERMNEYGRSTRLDEAAKAVHVAQRCGTDRRPACHVPLPARRGCHINLTVNYERRQVAKPWVASVAVFMNPVPTMQHTGRTDHARSLVRGWPGVPRDVGQRLEWFIPVALQIVPHAVRGALPVLHRHHEGGVPERAIARREHLRIRGPHRIPWWCEGCARRNAPRASLRQPGLGCGAPRMPVTTRPAVRGARRETGSDRRQKRPSGQWRQGDC